MKLDRRRLAGRIMQNTKYEWKFELWLIVSVPCLLILGALIYPILQKGTLPAIFMFYGFYSFFKAKISEKYRRKVYVTWGPGEMNTRESTNYYIGYTFMLCGVGSAFWYAFH